MELYLQVKSALSPDGSRCNHTIKQHVRHRTTAARKCLDISISHQPLIMDQSATCWLSASSSILRNQGQNPGRQDLVNRRITPGNTHRVAALWIGLRRWNIPRSAVTVCSTGHKPLRSRRLSTKLILYKRLGWKMQKRHIIDLQLAKRDRDLCRRSAKPRHRVRGAIATHD